MGFRPVLTLTFLTSILALSAPAQAGFDWIAGENDNRGASHEAAASMEGYQQLSAQGNANRTPEIYIKRQKISPRDARAELEKTDYNEITLMNALIIEDVPLSDQPIPMVMQSHSQNGPVQIVPVRPNYAGGSNVAMNAPEIIMDSIAPSSDYVTRPSAIMPVSRPIQTSAANYGDYRTQNNFVQMQSLPAPTYTPAPEFTPMQITQAPMLVADVPLAPLAPIMKATSQNPATQAMTFIPDPLYVAPILPAPSQGLSINPYPKAGLNMPASATQQTVPTVMRNDAPIVAGFGSGLPLVIALQQIVPPIYSYKFGQDIDLGENTSWSGGKSWDLVLMDMLAPLGLVARIEGKTIRIEKSA